MSCGSKVGDLTDYLADPIPIFLATAAAALLVMALNPPAPAWAVILEGAAALAAPILLARLSAERRRSRRRASLAAAMIETEPGPRLIARPNGGVLYANTAAERLFAGEDPVAVLTRRVQVHGEDQAEVRAVEAIARLRLAAAGQVAETIDLPLPGAEPDSEPEWVRVSVRPLAGPPAVRRLGAVMWSLEDVTARHAIEEVLRRDHDDLIDFFDFAPVGLFTADAGGRFIFANQRLAEWLGQTPDTLKGRLFSDVIAAPPAPEMEEDGRGEVKFVSRGGELFQAFVAHAQYDDGGEIRTRSVVVRDVMAEREWKQALRDAEARFRWLFDEAPVGVALLDLDAAITDCNPAFAAMVGDQRPALAGQPLTDRIVREDRADVGNALSKVVMGLARAAHLEVLLRGPRERAASMFISPTGEDGDVTGLVVHFIDTTEQRSLEIQFAQAQKMQAMGQLAGGVAHDFNNLLTAMIGFCDLLLQRHGAGDPSFADIMQIKQNANRAANLIRQLLAFSRRQPLQPRMLDVSEALAELSHLLHRLLGETIELKLVHGRDLGLVRVDPGQFDQVIINLAVNARDAMPGGGALTIRTSVAAFAEPTQRGVEIIPAGQYVVLEVIDTGTGIPKENIGRIFEPFFSTKQGGAGTGLGLSTVYGIVRQTDGFVLVDSAVGEGAHFTIVLPRYEPESPAAEEGEDAPARLTLPGLMDPRRLTGLTVSAATPGATLGSAAGLPLVSPATAGTPSPTPASPAGLAPGATLTLANASAAAMGPAMLPPADLSGAGTVLLVEDEDAVRTFAARALRNKGYSVIEAGNGEAAIAAARDTPAIDILISDMVMPGMDGATLARLVRSEWPDIRLLLMSGYSDEISRGELADLDGVHFLPKPFSLDMLAGTVKRVMDGAPPRSAPARAEE